MNSAPFQGLIAAPFTPLKPDGSLNLNEIKPYASHLRRCGVAAVFGCGTTGEETSLTVEDRQAVAARWTEHGAGLRTIVHVGTNCLTDSCVLAEHAAGIGAEAFGCFVPSFSGRWTWKTSRSGADRLRLAPVMI